MKEKYETYNNLLRYIIVHSNNLNVSINKDNGTKIINDKIIVIIPLITNQIETKLTVTASNTDNIITSINQNIQSIITSFLKYILSKTK